MKKNKVSIKIFLEVKKACTKIWESYDNLNGYRDKKLSLLNSFTRKDENCIFFMLQMFHPVLRKAIISTFTETTKNYIKTLPL